MLASKLSSSVGTNSASANYIEDVFSTYLYTGNAPSSQSITNGIDLAGKGGLVWLKNRSVGTGIGNELYNTNVGAGNFLSSNNTNANTNTTVGGTTYGLSSFNSNGFTVNDNWSGENTNGQNIVSWTFRKQPKFFDVVTWTGDGTDPRSIPHNLGSVPGAIFVKNTSGASNWIAYHKDVGTNAGSLLLNSTAAQSLANVNPSLGATYSGYVDTANSTSFRLRLVDQNSGFAVTGQNVNQTGQTYVAYLFAHDAGGFGLTGTDNVISCGSFTTDSGGNATVNLGYEAQWVLFKPLGAGTNWEMYDTMRGASYSGAQYLAANTSAAEGASGSSYYPMLPTATGFTTKGWYNSSTLIYIAIRRGPMKVPTSGTKVYSGVLSSASSAGVKLTTGFPVDLQFTGNRDASNICLWSDRLRGVSTTTTDSGVTINSASAAAESTASAITRGFDNTGFLVPSYYGGSNFILWNFRRAPSFFDEVCYTGTGSARTVTHNLAAVPELMIVKARSAAQEGVVYSATTGATKTMFLFSSGGSAAAITSSVYWNNTAPTSSNFTVGTAGSVNDLNTTYVAYLFATCAGVSKVGGYTGTGTTLQVDCGFTGGARFVLIKRTDSTGNWYVWDTARGIVSGNDPYLLLNSTAAETTGTDYIDTYSAGFEISSTAPAAINASGGTFIFLAIA